MKTRNWIPSVFWIGAGVYVAIHAYGMGVGHLHSPGPGFIFFLAALLLIVLSIVDVAATLAPSPKPEGEARQESIWCGVRWQKLLLVFAAASAYVYVFNYLGYVVDTFLLMMLLFKAVEPTSWLIALFSSSVTTAFSYFLFVVWLKVPFPAGVLGF